MIGTRPLTIVVLSVLLQFWAIQLKANECDGGVQMYIFSKSVSLPEGFILNVTRSGSTNLHIFTSRAQGGSITVTAALLEFAPEFDNPEANQGRWSAIEATELTAPASLTLKAYRPSTTRPFAEDYEIVTLTDNMFFLGISGGSVNVRQFMQHCIIPQLH